MPSGRVCCPVVVMSRSEMEEEDHLLEVVPKLDLKVHRVTGMLK